MTAEPLPEDVVSDPVGVEIASRVRNLPGALDPAIKSGNFLNNILARFEMRDPSVFEVLLPNHEGDLTEGSLSNLFIVDGEGVLLTPGSGSGLLPGITRDLVMTLARDEGIPVSETSVRPDNLFAAKEAFLTASTIEILPIHSVDGRKLAGAAPGEMTTLLQARYREAVNAYLTRS
jgi:branched-chain amino acid aminotransferase